MTASESARYFGPSPRWKGHQRDNVLFMLFRGFPSDTIADILDIPVEKVQRVKSNRIKLHVPPGWLDRTTRRASR
jgi:hypothetical protein